jgi:hypothetical protein
VIEMVIREIEQYFRTFPLSSRDQLLKWFYDGDTKKANLVNAKLLKLVERGKLKVNRDRRPYVYFAPDTKVKKQSNKLDHYLAAVDFYIWFANSCREYRNEIPKVLAFEHNFGKGKAKPDIVLKWLNKVYFVEVQRTIIPQRRMDKKLKLYEEVYIEGDHERFGKHFTVWVVTNKEYKLKSHIPTKQTVVDFL